MKLTHSGTLKQSLKVVKGTTIEYISIKKINKN